MIHILHSQCILRGEIMTFYLFIYYYFTINTVPNNYIFLSVYLLKMSCGRLRVMTFQRLKI